MYFMKKEQTLGFLSVILFILGLTIIMANQPTTSTIVFGMILIAVSIITATYMVNFPAKKPKTRKKRAVRKKKRKKKKKK